MKRLSRVLVLGTATLAACSSSGLSLSGGDGGVGDGQAADLTVIGDGDLEQSCPPDQPSRQTVTFEITNSSAADRWLVTEGQYCLPVDIVGRTLALGYEVQCEGPAPPKPMATRYQRVAAGATLPLTWDARAISVCTQSIDCSTRGWPGAGIQSYAVPIAVTAAAGSYVARVAYETAAPSGPGCFTDALGDVTCHDFGGPGGGPFGGGAQTLCEATGQANASFTLPPAGDVTVPITIP